MVALSPPHIHVLYPSKVCIAETASIVKMVNVVTMLFLVSFSFHCSVQSDDVPTVPATTTMAYPFGDIRNCPTKSSLTGDPLYRMEVLPGLGFDNLRNYDMSQIVQYNYSLCKTTNDGRLLIPDDVIMVPIQRSRFETYSTIFHHWDNYTSMTSASVNFDASVYSLVSGKFGFEYQHVKEHQVNNEAKTTRTQLRNTLYKVTLEPDAPLNPRFKNRLLDISANIQNNYTEYASYLSELLVRDYGTHIIRNVEAGAIISQIDSISSQYVADQASDRTSITANASANFMGKFSFGISSGFSNGQITDDSYLTNRYHSQIMTIGGPSITENMTLNQWEAGVLNSLVAIDREGDPLHFIITSTTLPELPSPTLRELVDYVYTGGKMYYMANTHHGCTDPSSPNFDYEANLNDNSCTAPHTNFTFGGVFQTCQVEPGQDYENLCDGTKGAATLNPLTGNYTCPTGFEPIELHNGVITHVTKKKYCDEFCYHSGFLHLGRTCRCNTAWENVLSGASYQAYWCVATEPVAEDTGYLFGGIYDSKSVNPVTHSMTCPTHFIPLHIGQDLQVCVSDQYDLAYEYSIPFAGFFSCKVGNPLSTTADKPLSAAPMHCPKTYKQILATVDEGCEVRYCAKFKSNYAIHPPKLPPFHSKPGLKMNLTQAYVIQGPYGDIWVRTDQGYWERADNTTMTGKQVLQHLSVVDDSNKSLSASVSATTSSVVTIIVCTLVFVAIFGIYGVWKRKKRAAHLGGGSQSYSAIDDSHEQGDQGNIPIIES